MILSAIAAAAANRVIGRNGDLPWNIPEDMEYFRAKTKGHIIIMGRKTFESFGGKLLPNRLHVILTQQKDFSFPGTHVFHEVRQALRFCSARAAGWNDEVFVIGGAEIYHLLMPFTSRIYLTEIDEAFAGDTYFPEIDPKEFKEVRRERRPGPPPFSYVIYEKGQES